MAGRGSGASRSSCGSTTTTRTSRTSPPVPYDQLFADRPYDGEIAYADESLGTLLDRLKRDGLYDRTLVVFTADHGEGLSEHDELTHSYLLYDSTLHVPLVMRGPGVAPGRRVAGRVRLVDVAPTVLDVLDIPVPADMQGRSLEPLLSGRLRRARGAHALRRDALAAPEPELGRAARALRGTLEVRPRPEAGAVRPRGRPEGAAQPGRGAARPGRDACARRSPRS